FAFGARFPRPAPEPGLPLPAAAAKRSAAALRLPATCQLRSSALGVGPLPSSALRPSPPEPLLGPFLPLAAPGRPGLAITQTPMRSVCGIFQLDAGGGDR